MKHHTTPEQAAQAAQQALAQADLRLGLENGVLRCLVECQNAGDPPTKAQAMDVCRINLRTGEVEHPHQDRTPMIWYGGEIAVQLNGEFPTFDVKQEAGKLVLTPEALSKLSLLVKKPFTTQEMVDVVPLDGPLGSYEGKDVQRGQKMRVLVITGNKQYIEANKMRKSAESKGWFYRICATIDAYNVHLILYKPVDVPVAAATPPQLAPATAVSSQDEHHEQAEALAA